LGNGFYDVNGTLRITAVKNPDFSTSGFCDDSNVMEMMMLNNDNAFEEIDMG
jgi:hypothetical protein